MTSLTVKRELLLICIFFASLMLPGAVSGQEREWTLKQCIDYAWENNLQIRQADLDVSKNENLLKKYKLAFIPNFSFNTNYNMNWGRSVDLKDLTILDNTFSQNVSGAFGASIYLLDGLSKHFSIKSGTMSRDISIQNVEKLKNEISIQIARAYLQVLLSEQLLKTAQDNLASITTQRDRTRILYEQGSQPYSALLDMESQRASERVEVVSASSDLRKNTLTLMQLLDLQYDRNFKVSVPDSTVLAAYVENYAQEDVDLVYDGACSLPVIRAAELSLEKSRIDLKAAKGKYYPTISMSASYGSYFSTTARGADGKNYPYLDQINNNINPTLAFGLNVPIFTGYSVKTNVKNAQLEVRNQQLQLDISRQTLYKEIQQAVVDAESYYEKMLASKVNMDSMSETLKYTEGKFMVGALNSTDYIVARTKYSQAQSDFYQALYQFVFQLKIIDFYKLIPIEL